MADEDPNDAVLSDVEGDEDPVPIDLSPAPAAAPSSSSSSSSSSAAVAVAAAEQRIRDLQAELEEERRARRSAEDARSDLQNSFNRLKALAHEAIKKRDEAFRERDDAARSGERTAAELAEAVRAREEVSKQAEALRSEMDAASQMLVSGIEKISGKVGAFKNFPSGLPRSQKYIGLPSVAYGVIKRSNEIADELMKQIDAASKARDQAREQVDQRNYEIAIEVSQLEASIAGLRDEVAKNGAEIEGLQKTVTDREGRISELENEISELKHFGEERDSKVKGLEMKLDSQRPLLIDQLNYISKLYELIGGITKTVDGNDSDQSDSLDSLFMWNELDMDGNLHKSLEGTKSIYELANVAAEKVKTFASEKCKEVGNLNEKVTELLVEKQHIGTLLRSALYSKTNEVRQVAEEGLREAGIDLTLENNNTSSENGGENEVYVLAGALESTLKESQIKIIELQHLIDALRAESSLLKSRLDAQAKEVSQQKHQIEELKDRERLANENVEGLMMDIAAAEEEITRWKVAAEQEAAAGRAIEHEFQTQLSALQTKIEEARQATLESESKLKFKEEIAAAAMAAREAAEKSLKLADLRSTRLRERLEELTRQLEESDNRNDHLRNQNSYRYMCWPWQWLGLNFVRYQPTEIQQSNNEMELSEPLM